MSEYVTSPAKSWQGSVLTSIWVGRLMATGSLSALGSRLHSSGHSSGFWLNLNQCPDKRCKPAYQRPSQEQIDRSNHVNVLRAAQVRYYRRQEIKRQKANDQSVPFRRFRAGSNTYQQTNEHDNAYPYLYASSHFRHSFLFFPEAKSNQRPFAASLMS